MNDKILIVEDDALARQSLERTIKRSADVESEIVCADSASKAVKAAKRGDLTYCALDLGLPEESGKDFQPNEIDRDCLRGFDVLKALLLHNRFIQVRILSRHTDLPAINARIASELGMEPRILSPLDKNNDEADYHRKVAEDVQGMAPLRPVLDALRIRVVHPLERRFARRAWQYANKTKTWRWPTPVIVIRGEPRCGKDRWAYAIGGFRDVLHPSRFRVPMQQLDCSRVATDRSADSAKIELFGTRNYQHLKDAPSIFEIASGYNSGNHQIEYDRSNFALLSELGNLPANGQRLLLEVLDSNPERGGRITRAGAGNQSRQIGCGFIFTTNASLENRVVRSDVASEGELREDLFKRLTTCDWLYVPGFEEMGTEAFFEHLRLALKQRVKREIDLAPIVERSIKSACDESPGRLSQEVVDIIVDSFARSGDARVRGEHLPAALKSSIRGMSAPISKAADAEISAQPWSIQEFEKRLGKKKKQFAMIKFLLNGTGPASDREVIEAVNKETHQDSARYAATTTDSFGQLLSQTRKSWNDFCEESGYEFFHADRDALRIEKRMK